MGKRYVGLPAIAAALGCHPATVRRRYLRWGWPPLIKTLVKSQWRWEMDWDVYVAATLQRSAALRAALLKAKTGSDKKQDAEGDATSKGNGEGGKGI